MLAEAAARGHRVAVGVAVRPVAAGGGEMPLAACLRCGAWITVGRNALLAQPCRQANAYGAEALRRLSRGLFPRGGAPWQGATTSHLQRWVA